HRREGRSRPRRDTGCLEPRLIAHERSRNGHAYLAPPPNRHFTHDHGLARPRELEAEPDPEERERQRDDPAVDLERVLEDEKAVLDDLDRRDQGAAENAVEDDRPLHAGGQLRLGTSIRIGSAQNTTQRQGLAEAAVGWPGTIAVGR